MIYQLKSFRCLSRCLVLSCVSDAFHWMHSCRADNWGWLSWATHGNRSLRLLSSHPVMQRRNAYGISSIQEVSASSSQTSQIDHCTRFAAVQCSHDLPCLLVHYIISKHFISIYTLSISTHSTALICETSSIRFVLLVCRNLWDRRVCAGAARSPPHSPNGEADGTT